MLTVTTAKVNGNVTLRFSFVGYLTQDLPATSNTLNVTLVPDAKQLKDVVVIGYGTSSKKDVTGAIATLKAEEFNMGVTTTPADLLQGKIAGLNITKSDDPNKAPTVILRGPSTFRTDGGAQEPFYVIDGVPGAAIDVLAPADIESIDVLKDAASTAIYGSRAANGVIIVTTKKAKSGQTRLSYSGYAGIQSVSKKIKMLTGDQLRQYRRITRCLPWQTRKMMMDQTPTGKVWWSVPATRKTIISAMAVPAKTLIMAQA
ncbi:TonB-dependent receptor plug domain-containing protein [Mucilaginibacter humi]|uniref:TonB-dependent receptor plug domain-containing protein n=1 Tax=Mucilaginibacter humi TaxID=2732510 RepID=UPI001FEC940A|nr:TonB-dependent receptor plug domain-containing protein [Mucilaginibacter humi]